MKNIKEAEELTGISRQNIRYYEKMGLLNPKRDAGNGYRKYDEEDIGRLKAILLFRKLDMPLEEIRKLLDHEIDLHWIHRKRTCRRSSRSWRRHLRSAIRFRSRILRSWISTAACRKLRSRRSGAIHLPTFCMITRLSLKWRKSAHSHSGRMISARHRGR